ncbi:STAS domain-containing protein [Actinomadura opuntiae]|uniref:STAS domain-containing protein n=1 Tax=Actinomadura sp. OS1-43 TaxID=604315 RepID=UPI00255AED60|nr:STAS domain-containing protein [Actinomadura sp. OS1-43]MDL4815408.1 STAS domain-containing protein [Actinomadura sp. OS1-43]
MGLIVESRFDPLHTDLAIVTVVGEVDVHTAAHLRDHLATLLARGARHLVLDFGGVAFIDSSGLGVLAVIYRLLSADAHTDSGPSETGTLALAAVNLRIREVLRTTGFTRFLSIYSTVELALTVHEATA